MLETMAKWKLQRLMMMILIGMIKKKSQYIIRDIMKKSVQIIHHINKINIKVI